MAVGDRPADGLGDRARAAARRPLTAPAKAAAPASRGGWTRPLRDAPGIPGAARTARAVLAVAALATALAAGAGDAAPPAQPLASLDYGIVAAGAAQPEDESWRAVRLPDGRAGFVDRRYLRSPIDYRAAFARIDGRWQMTLFLAGD